MRALRYWLYFMGIAPFAIFAVVLCVVGPIELYARFAGTFWKPSDAFAAAALFVGYTTLMAGGITLYWAADAYKKTAYQNLLGARHEFQRMLLEMNKITIADPYLAAVNYTRGLQKEMAFVGTPDKIKRKEKELAVKLAQFNYLRINMFEAAILHFCDKFETSREVATAIVHASTPGLPPLKKKKGLLHAFATLATDTLSPDAEHDSFPLDAWVLYYAEVLEHCYSTVSILQRESSRQVYAQRFSDVTNTLVDLVVQRNYENWKDHNKKQGIRQITEEWVKDKAKAHEQAVKHNPTWVQFQILKAQIVWRKAHDENFLKVNDRFNLEELCLSEKSRNYRKYRLDMRRRQKRSP